MDPDATLADIHTLIYELRVVMADPTLGNQDAITMLLIEEFEELDNWLQRSGAFPALWRSYSRHSVPH